MLLHHNYTGRPAITTLDGQNEKIEWSHLDAFHISTIVVIPGVCDRCLSEIFFV